MIDETKLKNYIPSCPLCGKTEPIIIYTADNGLCWKCRCGWVGENVEWIEK